MKARQIVEEMDSYVPGRSQDEIAQDFNLKKEDIIKLGSNENPWGPSPKAMKAIEDEIKSINRYPESQLHELVAEVAKYSGVESSQVIIGGDGADEIIDVLAKTFIDEGDEFIVPLPSYMYYEYLLKQYGAKPVYARWNLDENKLDVESIFGSITDKTKMIFLCSPNNPTGTLIEKEVLMDIAGKNPDVLIVIDEAYFEYSEVTNKDLINEFDNIFIIRTMSKVLGLAGMRIGYAIGSEKLIKYMNDVKFSVNSYTMNPLSQYCGAAAVEDEEYFQKTVNEIIAVREYSKELPFGWERGLEGRSEGWCPSDTCYMVA